MEFTIKRSQWLRGEGYIRSYLVRKSDNKMCCLGFFGLACGITSKEMLNVKSPNSVPYWTKVSEKSVFLFSLEGRDNSLECDRLMITNDEKETSDEEREVKITEIFARNGVSVKFED